MPAWNSISSRTFIQPPNRGDQRLLISADDTYLNTYGIPLVATSLLNCVPIHINALEPSTSTLSILKSLSVKFSQMISLSIEVGLPIGEERIPYCAASRFFCAHEVLERWEVKLLIVDTDSLLLRPFQFPLAAYGIYTRETTDARFRIAAGALYLSKDGLPFIRRFMDLYTSRRPWAWFDDQICLNLAHDIVQSHEPAPVVRISNRFLGFDYNSGIAVWSPKGNSKVTDHRYLALISTLRSLIDRVIKTEMQKS